MPGEQKDPPPGEPDVPAPRDPGQEGPSADASAARRDASGPDPQPGEAPEPGAADAAEAPDPPETALEEAAKADLKEADSFALPRETVERIYAAITEDDVEGISGLLEGLHPADIADLIEQMGDAMRRRFLALWGQEIDGEILSEIAEAVRADVIEALPSDVLGEAVRDLDSDDVVDLIEDLDPEEQSRLLGALTPARQMAIREALTYPEYSAGRLMQREVVRAPEHWTVGNAIDALRHGDDLHLPEQFYHVVLVDPKMRPVGYVMLSRILTSKRDVSLKDICEPSFRTVPVDQAESEVAYAFNQYHLITLPVVDSDDRLVGAITIDDAMAVLDDEHEEDILRLAGVDEESSLSDRVSDTVRRRLPWLAVNLGTAILASIVIGFFDEALTQVVALAILMPIVASMGGNAGTQSLTVAVRALATKDLTDANLGRVVSREVIVGLINGAVFAIVMGIIALLWFSDPTIGLVIAVAMIVNLAAAALSGILIPVAMQKFGVDPALASGTFVTTVTDVVGFLAFLGLGAALLL